MKYIKADKDFVNLYDNKEFINLMERVKEEILVNNEYINKIESEE